MSGKFRFILIDNPRDLANVPEASRFLGDLLISRASRFRHTQEDYLPLNPLDLCATHLMVYYVEKLFRPIPILGIRAIREEVGRSFNLQAPFEPLLKLLDSRDQRIIQEYRERRGLAIEFGSFFVDPRFSKSVSDYKLSEAAVFHLMSFFIRQGREVFFGASNLKYGAQKIADSLAEKIIHSAEFIHPNVPQPHLFYVFEGLNSLWAEKNQEMIMSIAGTLEEYVPINSQAQASLVSFSDFFTSLIRKGEAQVA